MSQWGVDDPQLDDKYHRRSVALSVSPYAEEDQAFVDAVAADPDESPAKYVNSPEG